MTSPTNLTGRLSHLHQERKIERVSRPRPPRKQRRPASERRMAHDPFLVLAYSLTAMAAVVQLALIVWLDTF